MGETGDQKRVETQGPHLGVTEAGVSIAELRELSPSILWRFLKMNSYQEDKKEEKAHKYANMKRRKMTGVEITPSQHDPEAHRLLFHGSGREAMDKADEDFKFSNGWQRELNEPRPKATVPTEQTIH